MSMKRNLRIVLRKLGYDIARYKPETHSTARMQQMLRSYNIETVLDIGANSGQFAEHIRNDLGYRNRIISFEPLSSAFASLKEKADRDSCWDVLNVALGDVEEESEINIAGNSYSSSLLDMLPSHVEAAPKSQYAGKETIAVKTLDTVFDSLGVKAGEIYMKIDTQGFEMKVLKGAEKSLRKINTVQMEMSLVPLYEGELLFNELYSVMESKGYSLAGLLPGFSDRASGQLLQVDGIFHRFE